MSKNKRVLFDKNFYAIKAITPASNDANKKINQKPDEGAAFFIIFKKIILFPASYASILAGYLLLNTQVLSLIVFASVLLILFWGFSCLKIFLFTLNELILKGVKVKIELVKDDFFYLSSSLKIKFSYSSLARLEAFDKDLYKTIVTFLNGKKLKTPTLPVFNFNKESAQEKIQEKVQERIKEENIVGQMDESQNNQDLQGENEDDLLNYFEPKKELVKDEEIATEVDAVNELTQNNGLQDNLLQQDSDEIDSNDVLKNDTLLSSESQGDLPKVLPSDKKKEFLRLKSFKELEADYRNLHAGDTHEKGLLTNSEINSDTANLDSINLDANPILDDEYSDYLKDKKNKNLLDDVYASETPSFDNKVGLLTESKNKKYSYKVVNFRFHESNK